MIPQQYIYYQPVAYYPAATYQTAADDWIRLLGALLPIIVGGFVLSIAARDELKRMKLED